MTSLRILLVHPMGYLSALGGGTTGNRIVMEQFAARGHRCQVITRSHHLSLNPGTHAPPGTVILSRSETEVVAERNGVMVRNLLLGDEQVEQLFSERLAQTLDEFQPDLILVNEEVQILPAHPVFGVWLERTLELAHGTPVITFVKTVICTPWGPWSFFPGPPEQVERCRSVFARATGIVTSSNFGVAYLEQHAGLKATALPWPVYGTGPYPDLSSFSSPVVGTINPGRFKGASILIALATAMPSVRFGARLSWTSTSEVVGELEALSNFEPFPYAHGLAEIYRPFSIVLVPSLCPETFGRVPVEAMAHGIPVIAADLAGLREAMLGRPYLCPVRPIEKYDYMYEARGSEPFRAVIPDQDVGPWQDALASILASEDHYRELSTNGRQAALRYIEQCSVERFHSGLFAVAGLSG